MRNSAQPARPNLTTFSVALRPSATARVGLNAGHQQRDGLARETAKPAVRHGAATWAPAWRGHPTSARHARVRDRGRGQCFYESWSQSPDM